MEALKHNDCRNFCTVDAAKGICRRLGELVAVDTDTCNCLSPLPKCKNCDQFTPTEGEVGTCGAEKNRPWAYREMVAVTCEWYKPVALGAAK